MWSGEGFDGSCPFSLCLFVLIIFGFFDVVVVCYLFPPEGHFD
jgi:hypothetical protein